MTEVLPASARKFQGLRAGIVSRVVAASLDGALVAVLTLGAIAGWSLLLSLGSNRFTLRTPGRLQWFVLGEVLLCIYLWIGWSTTGRTVGKQVMGLRLVNHQGELVRSGAACVRAVFCVVFPIGLFWCAVSQHNRSVQDVVLRTSVIYDWNVRLPPRATSRAHPGQERQPSGQTGPKLDPPEAQSVESMNRSPFRLSHPEALVVIRAR